MINFRSLAQSLFFAGTFATAPFVGMIADWFGRKRACLIFMGPGAVLWILSYFIDNVYLWLALRFFLGSGTTGFSMSRAVYLVSKNAILRLF
jgi:MFS family permease